MFQGKEIVVFFRDRIQLFSEMEDNSVSGIQEQEIALFQREEIDHFSHTEYSYFQRQKIARFQVFRDRLFFRNSIQLFLETEDTVAWFQRFRGRIQPSFRGQGRVKYGMAIPLIEGQEGTMSLIKDKTNYNNESNTVHTVYFTRQFVHWQVLINKITS